MVFYLCVCLFFTPSTPLARRGATLVKQGWGSLFFPGRWHVSQQREKARRPSLAGRDLSQRPFACCHSQSKMPPLPRSPRASFLFVSLRCTHHTALGLQVWPRGHPGPLGVVFPPQELGVEGGEGLLITLKTGHPSPQTACQKQPGDVEFEVWGEHRASGVAQSEGGGNASDPVTALAPRPFLTNPNPVTAQAPESQGRRCQKHPNNHYPPLKKSFRNMFSLLEGKTCPCLKQPDPASTPPRRGVQISRQKPPPPPPAPWGGTEGASTDSVAS